MADDDEEDVNEWEQSFEGCYGSKVKYNDLEDFLKYNFKLNDEAAEGGFPRFAACIWGHCGIGKTSIVKQFAAKPVVWNGKEYDGYAVHDVPVAQFEEMGDLHGLPVETILMRDDSNIGMIEDQREEKWVFSEVIKDYRELGWTPVKDTKPRMEYAAPDWVPTKPGPSILLLDDWNRASVRIIKGIMQLLQNYGMVSWSLPPGCNIVLTGNPDEQDYLVTSIDSAILTRIKHITLLHDVPEWAVWAESAGLDKRGISFLIRYPELMTPAGENRLTNPRTLSEFFRFLLEIPSIENNRDLVRIHGESVLDEETVRAFLLFCSRDMELVVEPEEILEGKTSAFKHVQDLMTRKEKRTDILNIICERLFVHMCQKKTKITNEAAKNFQKFISLEEVPDDTRHSICRRIAARRGNERDMSKWLLGDKKLKKLILETMM